MAVTIPALRWDTFERMQRAVDKVQDRLHRAVHALEKAGVDYAVVGGNAVAVWVSQVDEDAVRNTRDVDILLRRSDLDRAKAALGAAGFVYRHVRGLDIFRDGAESRVRDSVHILFAGERMTSEELLPNPVMEDSVRGPHFRVLSLEALVRTKLVAFRDKDRTHLIDLWELGLIDQSWAERYPTELGERLKNLLDTADENSSLSYRSREIKE